MGAILLTIIESHPSASVFCVGQVGLQLSIIFCILKAGGLTCVRAADISNKLFVE